MQAVPSKNVRRAPRTTPRAPKRRSPMAPTKIRSSTLSPTLSAPVGRVRPDGSPRAKREPMKIAHEAQESSSLSPMTFQEILKIYYQHIKELLEESPVAATMSAPEPTKIIQDPARKLPGPATDASKPLISQDSSKKFPTPASEPLRKLHVPLVKRLQKLGGLSPRAPAGPTLSSRFYLPQRGEDEASDHPMSSPKIPTPRLVMDAGNMPRSQPPPIVKLPRPGFIQPGFNGGAGDSVLSKYSTPQLRFRGDQMWPARPCRPEGDMGNNERERRWRLDIAHDTLKFLEARDWPMWQPQRVNIRYNIPFRFGLPPVLASKKFKTEFIVSSEDSLSAALRILKSTPQPYACARTSVPLVLNMANARVPGGGFLHGCRAQEEDLCRLTDLFTAIQSAKYPLPEFGANYTFPVSILRDSKHTSYQFLKSSACHPAYFPQVAVISSAAYEQPEITPGWRRKMIRKVEALMVSAGASGHEVVILSAWGCGAFGNPANVVAEIFGEVLQQAQFSGRFRQVIFALDTRRSDRHLDFIAKSFLTVFKTKMYRPENIELDPDVSFIECEPPEHRPIDEMTMQLLT